MGAVSLTCPNCSTSNVVFSPDDKYVIINIDFNPNGIEAKYKFKKSEHENTFFCSKIGS